TAVVSALVTSRDQLDIQEALWSFQRLRMESRLQEVDNDIAFYVDHRLQSDQRLKRLSGPVKSDIKQALSTKSASMFRLVQCTLDSIAMLRTVRSIRVALQELPQGLNQVYENILTKVPKSDIEIVRRTLLWLAFAVLPVSLDELHSAIAIEHGQDELDTESCLYSSHDIFSVCGSLINVSDQGHVRLAHLSVKDYLLSPEIRNSNSASAFALTISEGNQELTLNCLTYVSFREFHTGPSRSSEEYANRLARHPFLKHASTAWTYYFRASGSSSQSTDLVLDFFSPHNHQAFMSWVQVLNANFNFKWNVFPRHDTSLYYAASFGLTDIVITLIGRKPNLDAPGSRFGGTALHGAAIRYHTAAVEALLKAGANPNQADFNHITPLHSAAGNGNLEVIRILLDYNASKEVTDQGGETPLDWAVKAGHKECQDLL
ncbi:hypothetical protein AOQ84DRAFT_246552, partial [Glonium stellatum]